MAQFEVGGYCVCIEGGHWENFVPQPDDYGPKTHEKLTIVDMGEHEGDLFLEFAEYQMKDADGETGGYHSIYFRPLESWPDALEFTVEETPATIHELQTAEL